MSASTIFRRGTSFAVDRLKIYGKNRTRLIEDLRNKGKTSGLVLLQGGKAESACFFDTDMELLFRQEAFMHWAFGVETEDIVGVLDLDRSESALFVPRLPAEYAVWLGKVEPPSTFKEMYGVTEAGYLEDLERFVQARQPSTLYVLSGVNSDSGRPTYGFDVAAVLPSLSGAVQVDTATLYPSMVSLRRRKTPEEIEVMRYSSLACSHAHVAALRACKPGMMEFQLESLFLHVGYRCDPAECDRRSNRLASQCISVSRIETIVDNGRLNINFVPVFLAVSLLSGPWLTAGCPPTFILLFHPSAPPPAPLSPRSTFGCRHSAYTSIVASGPNPAVLHYGHAGAPNSREMQAGDMVLCDMGLDYNRYASDITCTYPVNGASNRVQCRAIESGKRKRSYARGTMCMYVKMHSRLEMNATNSSLSLYNCPSKPHPYAHAQARSPPNSARSTVPCWRPTSP